jgi:hypothetical protein
MKTVWQTLADLRSGERLTPRQADIQLAFDKLKEIEHLKAIVEHSPDRIRRHKADRDMRHRRWLLAHHLAKFTPMSLPDGRTITSGDSRGNFGLIITKP